MAAVYRLLTHSSFFFDKAKRDEDVDDKNSKFMTNIRLNSVALNFSLKLLITFSLRCAESANFPIRFNDRIFSDSWCFYNLFMCFYGCSSPISSSIRIDRMYALQKKSNGFQFSANLCLHNCWLN